MTKIAENTVAKLSVAFVTVAMLFTMVAPAAQAQSSDLQAQIAALLEQIAQLEAQIGGGSSSTSCVAPMAPLTIGSQGAEVTSLQTWLMAEGEVIPAGATGYFGSQTQAALASWQAANGVSPAVGYYGPITKAAVEAACTTIDEDDDVDVDVDVDGELGNDEGSIDSISEMAADESNLEEGEFGGIFAFELEIEGDLMIDRMDIFAEIEDSAVASDNADDYFESASLWVDGEMVAELDEDEFDDDDYTGNVSASTTEDEYRLRFSGLDLVFEDGDEPEFQLAFQMLDNIDSDDLDGEWRVALDSIRYIDGVGFSGSETYGPTAYDETFSIEAEDTADISITESNDSPDATTIEVDADDRTDDVQIYAFDVEEENGVDVTIDEVKVDFDSSDGDLSSVLAEAKLMVDGDVLDSTSVTSAGLATFEDLDFDMDGDEEVEFWVEVDFKKQDGNYAEGTTIFVNSVEISELEDDNGNDESEITTLTRSADGETHTLRTEGLMIGDASFTETVKDTTETAGGEEGVYKVTFDVTAFEDAMYIPVGSTKATSSVTNFGVVYMVQDENGDSVESAGTSTAVVSSSASKSGNYFEVEEGETESFTLTVNYDPAADGFFRVALYGVNFNVGTAATADSVETATPSEDYESDYLNLDA